MKSKFQRLRVNGYIKCFYRDKLHKGYKGILWTTFAFSCKLKMISSYTFYKNFEGGFVKYLVLFIILVKQAANMCSYSISFLKKFSILIISLEPKKSKS